MITDQLIERCVRKEPKAQYEMYRALYPVMIAICIRYERNRQDATSRMNQGFLKVLDNIGARGPEVPFMPWVRRIIINTVIDGFRSERTRKEMERLDTPTTAQGTNVNEYLEDMEAEALAELLMHVPPTSRHVFNLFAIDGMSHAEIADALGISAGTSKWHVAHARQILQRAIASTAFVHNQQNETR